MFAKVIRNCFGYGFMVATAWVLHATQAFKAGVRCGTKTRRNLSK